MHRAALDLALIMAAGAALGFPFVPLLNLSSVLLAPVIVSAIVAWISTVLFYFGFSIDLIFPSLLGIFAAAWLVVITAPELRARIRKLNIRTECIAAFVMAFAAFCILVLHGYQTGEPVVRIGPDQPIYISSGDYILSGGDINSPEFSRGRPFNLSTADVFVHELIFVTKRIGPPATVAFFAKLLRYDNVRSCLFPFMLAAYFQISLLAYLLLKPTLGVLSVPGAILATLNPIVLNGLFEGFYAQIFTLPFVYAFLYLIFFVEIPFLLAPTLMLLAIVSSYTEAAILTGLVILFALLLDKVVLKKGLFDKRRSLALGLVSGITALGIFPLLQDFVVFQWNNIAQVGKLGFSQPHYALPDEVIGLRNLYHGFEKYISPDYSTQSLARTDLTAQVMLIPLVSYLMLRGAATHIGALLLAPLFVVSLPILKGKIQGLDNTYTQMKICMEFFLLFAVLFYSGASNALANRGKILKCSLILIFVGLCIDATYDYLRDWKKFSIPVADNAFTFLHELRRINPEKFLLTGSNRNGLNYQFRYLQRSVDQVILSDSEVDYLETWGYVSPIPDSYNAKVVHWVMRSRDPSFDCLLTQFSSEIILKNDDFAAFRTPFGYQDIKSSPEEVLDSRYKCTP